MTEEEIKNKISEHKECFKKLAEEYRQRYNEDNSDKLALNMFYHNVISFNDFETALSIIEDRNSMIMCFSEPPYLTEETVEVDIKRIADLEKENAELKKQLEHRNCVDCSNHGSNIKLLKAKEIILRLYNAGRDVLMCRAEEKAYDNLSNAINDKSIEQFLSEVENV